MSRTTRQPAAPGRNVRRSRSPRSATEDSAKILNTPSSNPLAKIGRRLPPLRNPRDLGLTRRAIVLAAVVLLLAASLGNPIRTMLAQQEQLDETNRLIAQRAVQVADLEAQLQQWRDPAYVTSQARTQLGWVMPGETGYRVIGDDGKVLSNAATGSAIADRATVEKSPWWQRLSDSIQTADGATTLAKR